MCRCHSIPLSNGAAEAEVVSTETSCCGLWQAKAVLSYPYHGTQCSFCCRQPRPGLLPVLGLDFEEQPHHLLLSFMQKRCRRMQENAGLSHSTLCLPLAIPTETIARELWKGIYWVTSRIPSEWLGSEIHQFDMLSSRPLPLPRYR